jgi:hypothetical protein
MDRPLIPLGYDSIAPLLSLELEGGAMVMVHNSEILNFFKNHLFLV